MQLPAQETHKHFQVSGTDQAIAAVVPWPAHYQHGRLAGGEGTGWVGLVWDSKSRVMLGKRDTPPRTITCFLYAHLGNGGGTAQPRQLHQLIHAELVLREELLVDGLGLVLPGEGGWHPWGH